MIRFLYLYFPSLYLRLFLLKTISFLQTRFCCCCCTMALARFSSYFSHRDAFILGSSINLPSVFFQRAEVALLTLAPKSKVNPSRGNSAQQPSRKVQNPHHAKQNRTTDNIYGSQILRKFSQSAINRGRLRAEPETTLNTQPSALLLYGL